MRSSDGSSDVCSFALLHDCEEPGSCPAPKSPNPRDRWYFCKTHAAEYNAGWDYFEGLDKAEREERTRSENRDNAGYAEAAHYGWAGSGDGSRSSDEMRALELLGLEADADFAARSEERRVGNKCVSQC